MSPSPLPAELLYCIFADIVAEYVDAAITRRPLRALPGPDDEVQGGFSSGTDADSIDNDDFSNDPRFELIRRHRPMDHFLRWTVAESLEPLLKPKRLIGLLTVNRQFYNVLTKVLDDALGRPTKVPHHRWSILKELRREYRRTLTPSLPSVDVSIKNTTRTSLITAYIRLIQAQHFLRDVKGVIYKPEEYTADAAEQVERCFLGTFNKLIPQEPLRGRVKQRMAWAKARISFFKELITLAKKTGVNLHRALLSLHSPTDELRDESLENFETTIQELIDFLDKTTSERVAMEHLLMPHIVSLSSIQMFFTTLSELPLRSIPSVHPDWLERMLDVQEWGSKEKTAWDTLAERWEADYELLHWGTKTW
ncbi:hypothetical protein DL96DRAFT_1597781 [Flagelloscypha sp. PMI_526]|nr:hypothetical protein DL96DRAFT_1597781 [Flagelloscypha sp. PMI_526]